MAAIRAVVFDLGHTLWDFAPREDARRLVALRLHERLGPLNGSTTSPNTVARHLSELPAVLDRIETTG